MSTSASLTLLNPLTVHHNNCGKFLKRWEYQTTLPLYGSRSNRTRYGVADWFKIGQGVREGCIFLPCLFNFNVEYIKQNSGLYISQAGIKIAKRTIWQITEPQICR